MKDEFLYGLRKEPSTALTRSVYRDIATLPSDEPPVQRTPTTAAAGPARRRHVLAWAALLLLAFFTISSFASPAVRAIVDDIVRQIGGFTVRETDIYPLKDGYRTVADTNQYLTLVQAREAAMFELALPSELPDRYTLVDEVIVSAGGERVSIRWRNEESRGDGLWLDIFPANPDAHYLIGGGAGEIIDINGQEGLFIRGGWYENTESWNPDIRRDVRWTHDGRTYHLSGSGPNLCPDEPDNRCPLTDEELISIAESVE